MTANFRLNDPQLMKHLHHIEEYPADPLYNSFIINGNEFGAALALAQTRRNLRQKYPQREILFYTGPEFQQFIRQTPIELLQNFLQLHPHLLAVIVEWLEVDKLTTSQQDTLGVFLKHLTAHHIQVIASTPIIAARYGINSTPISREMWSWFMSAREYVLPNGCVQYIHDLTCSLSLEQDKKRFKWLTRLRKSFHFGELYPGILSQDEKLHFHKNMNMELGLCWFGKFAPPANIFPRAVCPTCGKVQLIPYSCIASMLSGGHVIKFYCLHCGERFAINQALDYFRVLRTYGTHVHYRFSKQRTGPDIKKGE